MYYKYRNFTHSTNDVKLTVSARTKYDNRGFRRGTIYTHKLDGFLKAATPALLTTAMNALKLAYSVDGGNAGLYEDSGAVTTHYLDSASALGGVRVMGAEWPDDPGAYTTYLPYSITLEAEYPVPQNDDLMAFEETIDWSGDGGERWILIPTLYGAPRKQIVNRQTTVKCVQSGSAIGFTSYPPVPPPIWPTAEHRELRQIGAKGPQTVGGKRSEFGVKWTYFYEADSLQTLSGSPTLR